MTASFYVPQGSIYGPAFKGTAVFSTMGFQSALGYFAFKIQILKVV